MVCTVTIMDNYTVCMLIIIVLFVPKTNEKSFKYKRARTVPIWLHDSNSFGLSEKENQPKPNVFLKQISPGLFDIIKIVQQKNPDKLKNGAHSFRNVSLPKTTDDNSLNGVIKKILLERKMNGSKSGESPIEEIFLTKLANRGNDNGLSNGRIGQPEDTDNEQMINETIIEKQEPIVPAVGQPCFAFELLEGIAEFGLGIIKFAELGIDAG